MSEIRLLTITNLYPSVDQPRHGIFVEQRLRQLVATGKLGAQVVALRPDGRAFLSRPPTDGELRSEVRHGIQVEYVRVPTLPWVTNWIDPWLWANAAEAAVRRLLGRERHASILDAHFLYPDGVAAVVLARRLGLPVVMTARGSDVNVKCDNPVMRSWVRWAANNCSALVAVSQALANRLASSNIRAPRMEVLRNGVDLEQFRPGDRLRCRDRFNIADRLVVSVGHLVPEKGHHIAIDAISDLPDTGLLIVGEGTARAMLEGRVRDLGLQSRVRFLGNVPHQDMAEIYNAADALALPSLREGLPNVVLESLACGTRVAATDVGGIGEIVVSPVAGRLFRERTPSALRSALEALFADAVDVEQTRRFAERFSWEGIVEKQLQLYRDVLSERHSATLAAATQE